MASESYKLQINNCCITSVTRKSTIEWWGLKHALKCLILNFDGSIKKTFAWTSKRPCARQLSTNIACKKVSFATIGWTNRQQTTHPDQLDWLIVLYSSKNKRNYSNDNSVWIVIKLLKILAVNTTKVSELGTVATSNNRQQHHRQLQLAQSKPSMITMDAIDAIIVKHQSPHETFVRITRRGELWQLASKPQGGLADKRDKGVVRTLWVSWWYSSRDNNLCQRSINNRNASTTNANSNQEVL